MITKVTHKFRDQCNLLLHFFFLGLINNCNLFYISPIFFFNLSVQVKNHSCNIPRALLLDCTTIIKIMNLIGGQTQKFLKKRKRVKKLKRIFFWLSCYAPHHLFHFFWFPWNWYIKSSWLRLFSSQDLEFVCQNIVLCYVSPLD